MPRPTLKSGVVHGPAVALRFCDKELNLLEAQW